MLNSMDYFDKGFMSLRIHPTQVGRVGLRAYIKTPQLLLGVYGTKYRQLGIDFWGAYIQCVLFLLCPKVNSDQSLQVGWICRG